MKAKSTSGNFIALVFLSAMVFFTVFPFLLMINMSFKSSTQFLLDNFGITFPFHFKNYYYAILSIAKPMLTSAVIAVVSISVTLFISALAAYAFGRYEFPGSNVLFLMIIGVMMIPGILLFVPQYVLMVRLNLFGSAWSLNLVYIASGVILAVFILRTFFAEIPRELIEAGNMDGASGFVILMRIILPISLPVMATLAIMQFLTIWNDYLWPLVMLSDSGKRTLALAVRFLGGEMGLEWGITMAGYTLACAPTLILFALATKPFIRGITSGAIKI
jgi:ABC-type glycerol-3-phosphate transport system permease component